MLGTNDASVLGRKVCSDRFVSDYSAIVAQYQQASGKQPRVILAMPPQYSDLEGVSGYSGSRSRHPGRDLQACPEDCRRNVQCYLGCKVTTRAQNNVARAAQRPAAACSSILALHGIAQNPHTLAH
jgi:hypothetical protein